VVKSLYASPVSIFLDDWARLAPVPEPKPIVVERKPVFSRLARIFHQRGGEIP
jgi:hypothetical protein